MQLEHAGTNRPLGLKALIGVLLVPLLFAAGFLAATWKSADHLKRVDAAVVNLDEPVTVNGQMVPLGRELAGGLAKGDPDDPDKNFNWKVTKEDDARSGLASGRYAAIVVIPKSFSADATSYGDADPQKARQATVDVETSQIVGIADATVGQTIADTARRTLNKTLTESYLDNIYLGFNKTGEQFGEVADGAGKLADGSGELGNGIGEAAKGADEFSNGLTQLDNGAGELAAGGPQLKTGGQELAGGLGQLSQQTGQLPGQTTQLAQGSRGIADGAQQLSGGTAGVADGARGISDGLGAMAPGAKGLADGLNQMKAGVPQAASGVSRSATGAREFATGAQTWADGATDYGNQLQKFSKGLQIPGAVLTCKQAGIPEASSECIGFLKGSAAAGVAMETEDPDSGQSLVSGAQGLGTGAQGLAGGANKMAGGLDTLSTEMGKMSAGIAPMADGATQLSDGLQQLAPGAGQLADGAEQLNGGAGQLASGADQVATGTEKLAQGMTPLSQGIAKLSTGASQYVDGVGQYADGVTQLSDGIHQAAQGAPGLAEGLHKLQGGSDELTKGQREMADGLRKGAEQVPHYDTSDRENLKSVVAAPVANPGEATATAGDPADDGILPALTSVSLLMALALWLGGLATYLVVRAIPARSLTSSEPSWRLTANGLLPGVAIGAVQALVITGLSNLVLELSAGKLVALFGVALLGAVTFAVVNHALVGWLGGAGRLISVAFAVLAAASGLTSAIPEFFDAVRPFNPLSPALDSIRAVATDGPGLGGALGLLVAWLLLGLVASHLSVLRNRVVTPAKLSKGLQFA